MQTAFLIPLCHRAFLAESVRAELSDLPDSQFFICHVHCSHLLCKILYVHARRKKYFRSASCKSIFLRSAHIYVYVRSNTDIFHHNTSLSPSISFSLASASSLVRNTVLPIIDNKIVKFFSHSM